MKRFLLVVAFLFMCNTVCADTIKPGTITVKEAYLLEKTNPITLEDHLNRITLKSYYLGIIDYVGTSLIVKNVKASNCISRPISVWFNIIFYAYQRNSIKGDEYFFSRFVEAVSGVCEVKLW